MYSTGPPTTCFSLVLPLPRLPDAPGHSGRGLRGLVAMQAVRRVLDGEEEHVCVRRRPSRMHHAGGNVDDGAGPRGNPLAADICLEGAFENVDPLFVGMAVGLRAGAGR